MKKIHDFNNFSINEGFGGYRGFGPEEFTLPSMEDIKDILTGMSLKKVLAWTPPKRAALSKTEQDLKDKKLKLLKKFGCPESYLRKKLKLQKMIVVDED